jgi:hypothetical protein
VQFTLPFDYLGGASVAIHVMGANEPAGASPVDSPTVTIGAYFAVPGALPGAESNVGGVTAAFAASGGADWRDQSITILAANAPAPPATLTLIVGPTSGTLPTDDFVMPAPWLQCSRQCLTS